jgi:hypothetical protein
VSIATDLIPVGAELITSIVELVMDAIKCEDPTKLRRVSDVLPAGHPLRARVAFLEAQAAAEKALRG